MPALFFGGFSTTASHPDASVGGSLALCKFISTTPDGHSAQTCDTRHFLDAAMPELLGQQSNEEPSVLLVEFGDYMIDTFMQFGQPSGWIFLALCTLAEMD